MTMKSVPGHACTLYRSSSASTRKKIKVIMLDLDRQTHHFFWPFTSFVTDGDFGRGRGWQYQRWYKYKYTWRIFVRRKEPLRVLCLTEIRSGLHIRPTANRKIVPGRLSLGAFEAKIRSCILRFLPSVSSTREERDKHHPVLTRQRISP